MVVCVQGARACGAGASSWQSSDTEIEGAWDSCVWMRACSAPQQLGRLTATVKATAGSNVAGPCWLAGGGPRTARTGRSQQMKVRRKGGLSTALLPPPLTSHSTTHSASQQRVTHVTSADSPTTQYAAGSFCYTRSRHCLRADNSLHDHCNCAHVSARNGHSIQPRG